MKTEVPLCWTAHKHRTVKGAQSHKKQHSKQIRHRGGKVHTQHKQRDCSKCNSSSILGWLLPAKKMEGDTEQRGQIGGKHMN